MIEFLIPVIFLALIIFWKRDLFTIPNNSTDEFSDGSIPIKNKTT